MPAGSSAPAPAAARCWSAPVECAIAGGGREVRVDLSRPFDLSVELDFQGPQVRHFGAPRAGSQPYSVPGFPGSVARGASCNCESITLIPHCNGTHTECAGHLTREPLYAQRIVPRGLLPALLISAKPAPSDQTPESSDPAPHAGDSVVTRGALQAAWPAELPFNAAGVGDPHSPQRARQAHARLHGYHAALPDARGGAIPGRARHRASGGGPALDRPGARRRTTDCSPSLLRPSGRTDSPGPRGAIDVHGHRIGVHSRSRQPTGHISSRCRCPRSTATPSPVDRCFMPSPIDCSHELRADTGVRPPSR